MDLKKLNMKFVSDLIGEDYNKWQNGDVVMINSPTGTGKNHFLINVLLDNLETNEVILYLCNRTALRKETLLKMYEVQNIEIPMDGDIINWKIILSNARVGNVVVRTYQDIGQQIYNNMYYPNEDNKTDFDRYKYVVYDEWHYILSDTFNCMTDLAYDRIMQADNTIKIFMSATMDEFKTPITKFVNKANRTLFEYKQVPDYSYLNINVYKKKDDIINLIKNDKSDNKWLVFVYSIKVGEELQELFGEENSIFVKAGSKEISDIVENKTFSTKILISTCALDNGINLEDENIKNIVVMDSHKTKFIQMIGRLRHIKKDGGIYHQTINLYMPKFNKGTYLRMLNKSNEYKDMVKLRYEDIEKFQWTYDRKKKKLPDALFYNLKDEVNLINKVGYWDLLNRIFFYERMVKKFEEDDNADISIRMQWLFRDENEFNEISNIPDPDNVDELEKYLESILGKRLFKEEKIELIDRIDHKVNYKQVKTYKGLNIGLDLIDLPYLIIPKKSGDLRYWIVDKIDKAS